MGAAAEQSWPEAIAMPTGFEGEGIELGKGHEFFVGANSFSSLFGPYPVSGLAGAIYKGNLRTGEGDYLVLPTGKSASGLSYDPRTDYLYAATGNGDFTDMGVTVYDASSGDVITEITFGDGTGIVINDCLVTRTGVYCTDSINPDLYKVVLEKGGRLPSTPVVEKIPMPDFEMVDGGFNANGLVGDFDGRQLVIVNITTGVLYLVDTESGEASAIEIEGAELFLDGDGLYLDGRTLYILQNFSNKIAVVQLSGDLSRGEFIRNIPGEGEINPLMIATTLIGFGNSLYAINTNFLDWYIFGEDPADIKPSVVRLRK